MRLFAVMLLASTATPAIAQDHSGHAMPPASATENSCQQEADRHRAMGHSVSDGSCAPTGEAPAEPPAADDHATMDHAAMGHAAMDHGQVEATDRSHTDHASMSHGEMGGTDHSAMNHASPRDAQMDMSPIPQGPPPAAAGSGPAHAADAIWGAGAMRASRDALRVEAGGLMSRFWFQADRAEYRAREGKDGYLWDLQGYYGGDIDKFWFKSEGEGSFGEKPEGAEIQGLWSHAIGPWWDLQAGIRQDLTGPERTYAVIGVQGLAPYLFEIDAAAFLSTKGDLTARVEAELDQRVTQRLILQPRTELNLAAQDIPELGIGAGFDSIELGLRLRYEIAREFAPYIGVEQEWKLGQSADFARLAGEDPSVTNYVIGVRFWF